MKIQNIGIMSPGDMGQAVAHQLKLAGFNVYTALDKRSARTRTLAKQAGIADVGSLHKLAEQCEVILSVMPPGAALEFAGELAQVLSATQQKVLFVDCNAVAPATMKAIAEKITAAGGRCVDAGITGPPPRGTAKTLMWVSGPEATELEQLANPLMTVRVLSERIGDASAYKMCYAALSKGTSALVLEVMIAARRLGIDDVLDAHFKQRFGAGYGEMLDGLPVIPPKAHRFVPEMLEIASTFESVGVTPRSFQGFADIYGYIATTRLGKETPENCDKSRTGEEVFRLIADEDR